MDHLVEAGKTTVDPEARKKIYAQVQQLAAQELPYVSLWRVDNVAVMNRRLVGFEAYPNGSFRSLATLKLAAPWRRRRTRRNDPVINHLMRRIFALVPVAIGVATLTFAIIHLVPGDPVIAMLGETAAPADIVGMRRQLGLDRPILDSTRLFRRTRRRRSRRVDFYRKPVARLIAERFPATIELAAAGMLVAISVGIPAGTNRGLESWRRRRPRRNGICDRRHFGSAHLPSPAAHDFVFSGSALAAANRPRRNLSPRLPAVTLGTALAAILARMLRQSLIRVRESDYMRTALSKGLSARAALFRHGLKNALTSVVTIIGLQMGALLSGTLITKIIFSWPGIGRLLITAIGARDYPVVEGCVLTFAMTYVVVNMATDLGLCDGRSASKNLVRTPSRNPSLAIGVTIVVATFAGGDFRSDHVSHRSSLDRSLQKFPAGPSRAHPFGCDALGRDILARILSGARLSLSISTVVVAISLVVGSLIGATAALSGGRIDNLIMRGVDIVLAFPGILLAIALAAILGPG